MKIKSSIFAGATLLFLLLAVGCREPEEEPTPALTSEIMMEAQEVIVTRVVRQIVEVEVTPIVPETEETIELDIPIIGDFENLDPQQTADDNDFDLIENVFVGLTRFNHLDTAVEPALARSWEVSNDGLTWTFHLRDDIYWIGRESGGPGVLSARGGSYQPIRLVDAYDIVEMIGRICDPRIVTPDTFIFYIIEGCEDLNRTADDALRDFEQLGVKAPDAQTVEITLTEPSSDFLTLTSTPMMRPLPLDIVEDMGDEWQDVDNMATSGPYLISPESVMDQRTVLLRNPYWPIPFRGNADTVNIVHMNSAEDTFELWEDRKLDVSPIPASIETAVLSQYGNKATLVPTQAVFYLAFNHQSPVFADPALRQAFSMAIDRERLVREVHDGHGLPMRHMGPPGVVGAPPINEVGIGYSPDRARQLVDSSSFGDCRLMPEVTFMVTSSDLALEQAETLREMWVDTLGCSEEQIRIEQVQFGTLLANVRADAGAIRPDIWVLGWSFYYPDEENWLGQVLHCSRSENRLLRTCGQIDNLIATARQTLDIEDRWELYRQIERELFGEGADQPIAPIFVSADYVLRQSWLVFDPANFGGEQFDHYYVDWAQKVLETIE